MTELVIRPVRREDYDAWVLLWEGYNAFYGRSGPTALDAEITRSTWERLFSSSEPVYALVATLDDMIVGLAHFLYHRSTTSIANICLQDLFTVEAARGRGVATALIEEVYRIAAEAKLARVYWQTHETNHIAQRVYDKVAEQSGFVAYRHIVITRNGLEPPSLPVAGSELFRLTFYLLRPSISSTQS